MRADTNTRAARLSLCMIVRDEAELLPEFLRHAQGIWDELVVVDTGSVDDTVAILHQAGATVIQEAWRDDFAHARNVGLEHAAGDWILVLDADEFISAELHAEIRGILNNPQIGAATVQLRSHLPHGHVHETALPRLFRNAPEIRFRFAIHEEVVSSLEPYLDRAGQQLVALSGVVTHHGYERERAQKRGKKERDLRILNRCLSEAPFDLYSHFKRLELARFWHDRSLWREAAQEARTALEGCGPAELQQMAYGGELISLIAQGMADSGAGLQLALHYRDQLQPSAELHYYIGEQLEIGHQLAEATVEFRAALQICGARNQQMVNVRPHMGLCRLALANGDPESALAHCQQALAHAPQDPEALLALMINLYARGGCEAAMRGASAHAAAHGSSPELWMAVGNSAMLNRDPTSAAVAYARAAEESGGKRPLLHLGKAKVLGGEWKNAHHLLFQLCSEIPEAGIGALVCDMCMDRDTDLQLDLQPAEADLMLREWLTTALMAADDHALTNIAKRAPSVQHIFPWLPEALGLAA